MHISSPQYYHNKGWIATPFKVKNNLATVLKWRKKNQTEQQHKHQEPTKSIIFKPAEKHLYSNHTITSLMKPSTAPEKPQKLQISENLAQIGPVSTQIFIEDEEEILDRPNRYSNFRTTINNKKQLLFLKPYLRYRNQSLTIQQKKTEIYKQINHLDLQLQIKNKSRMIEYMTEYNEPAFSNRSNNAYSSRITPQKSQKMKNNRASLNVLKEKLKKQCGDSRYKMKMNALKLF